MNYTILNNFIDHVFIDVRSEAEYEKGHITNAINLPILSNLERSEVGHLYKNVSVDQAKLKGLAYGSAKLQDFQNQIFTLSKDINSKGDQNKKIVLYCARGGYRSKSLYALLNSIDIAVERLEGGYKAYRQVVLSSLSDHSLIPHFIPINGLTGSGKTHILHFLSQMGEPVLDLEGAANHKGSNLGAIGTTGGQSAQQFENDMFTQLLQIKNIHTGRTSHIAEGQEKNKHCKNYAFVEMESRKIGKLLTPKTIYEAYANNPSIVVDVPDERRVENLMKDYAEAKNLDQELKLSLDKLKPYLAKEIMAKIIDAFENKNYQELTLLLLKHHYDKLYLNSITNKESIMTIHGTDFEKMAQEIKAWANSTYAVQ